jgi:hypothetical protein
METLDKNLLGKTVAFKHFRSGGESLAKIVGFCETPGFTYYMATCITHDMNFFKPGEVLTYSPYDFEILEVMA